MSESLEWSIGRLLQPRREKAQPARHPDLPYIGLEHVEAHSMRLLGSVPADTMRSQANRFYEGDVLYSRLRPYLNKVWLADRDGLCSSEFIVLPGNDAIDSDFLRYRLNARDFVQFANSLNAGDRPRVDFDQISSFILPPFSLEQQRRIVGKVEELFSELDEGVANLKQARAQLAVYRQALLKHAFEGHLTAIKGIKKVPLSSLITDLSQGWSPKCELNRAPNPDEWAVIKTTAIQHCRYDDTEAKPLPPPFEGRPSIEIKDGDFLMTRKGPRSRAGVSCYVRRTRPRLMVCDTVYRFRCIEDIVHPLYLELALNSPDVLRAIDQRKAGISESGLSLTHSKIGTVEIPLCSLDEQHDVVRQLDEQTSVMDALEADIDLNLQKAEALRQSILKKAFAGELVPQDPADEPAAALLARLRAEREAATAQSAKKKPATPRRAKA